MKTLVVAAVTPVSSPPITPPSPSTAAVVGDDAHVAVDRVGLAVEREEALAFAPEPRADRALELVGVIDMQRAGAVVGDVVGDIDQRVDGAKPDRLQPPLQPIGARPVLDAPHEPPGEDRAGARASPCRSRARWESGLAKPPLTGLIVSFFSLPRPAAARSRAMPRTPRQSGRFGVTAISITASSRPSAAAAGLPILALGVELDDAGMLVRQFQLALGEQHAVRTRRP